MGFVINAPGFEQGFLHNNTQDFIFQLKEQLKAVGWVVVNSGTGTAGTGSGVYDPAGDCISTVALMGNTRAWFQIRDPDSVRSFVFQNGWRNKYRLGLFAGGAPGAGTVPGDSPEALLLGAGTDASPSFDTFGNSLPGPSQYIIEDTAPWSVYAFRYRGDTKGEAGAVIMDVLRPGSYSVADPDPCVALARNCDSGTMWQSTPRAFATYPGSAVYTGVALNLSMGWGSFNQQSWITATYDSTDIILPAIWGRASTFPAPNGYKGISANMLQTMQARQNGDTQSVAATRDRILLGGVGYLSLPWNGTVPL
jgi:hypothetical protein